jgi:hypothetical protein
LKAKQLRAKAFVAVFAEWCGISPARALWIDRVLAEAGLRQKASGRAVPDVSLREAVSFAMALLLADDDPSTAATRVMATREVVEQIVDRMRRNEFPAVSASRTRKTEWAVVIDGQPSPTRGCIVDHRSLSPELFRFIAELVSE